MVTSGSDISVLGHFGPWARLVCRILAGDCSGVSRVSRVRVRLRLKVRVRDGCREGQRRNLPKLLWGELSNATSVLSTTGIELPHSQRGQIHWHHVNLYT